MAEESLSASKPPSTTAKKSEERTAIIPARGWERDAKGNVLLVAYPTGNTVNRVTNPQTCHQP